MNFREVSRHGNTLVDCEPKRNTRYIDDIEGLRQYINEHLPPLEFGEIKELAREFERQGYVEVGC